MPAATASGGAGPRRPRRARVPGRERARRGGRPQPVQADGDQGRVRGRPPLDRRLVPAAARPRVRALGRARGPSGPAAAGRARRRHRPPARSAATAPGCCAPCGCWPASSACAARPSTRSAAPPSAGWSAGCCAEYEALLDELIEAARRRQPRHRPSSWRACRSRSAASATSRRPVSRRAEVAERGLLERWRG